MDIKVDNNTVIVFDLDDTLYNELDFLKSAYIEIAMSLEPKDWKPLYSKMFSLYRNKFNVFQIIAKEYNIKIQHLIGMYRIHKPNIQLFDGVLDLLDGIKKKNGKIGIITDGRSITQRAKLQKLGIKEYIDKIVISEEIGSEKPNLQNFEAIEKSLSGNIYYYIADNFKKDFIAPNILGWKTIALVDNGKNIHYDSYQEITCDYLPKKYITSIQELKIL